LSRSNALWAALLGFLLLAFLSGALLFFLRYRPSPGLEIVLPSPTPLATQRAYIDGAVTSPGWYPVRPGESLQDLLRAAGPKEGADLGAIKVRIPAQGEVSAPQRVNLNTAPAWLLEALPGVGPRLAEAIIRYRSEQGPFQSPKDLQKVPGVGPELYRKVQDLISVGE